MPLAGRLQNCKVFVEGLKEKARAVKEAKEKKAKWEKKFPEAVPEAKGDLSAFDEEEENEQLAEEQWENYKKAGGTQTREQFDENQMIKACGKAI